jgi:ABC-type transport system involved in multi-copper enzyme maturation permease subunit
MLGKARVASVGISTLIALGGYIIVSLIGAATWLKWPARALPFYYYKPAEILEGTYNWNNMLFILGIIIAAAILSVVAFRKRDLSS